VGERVYLRFVTADGQAVLRDSLTCLRLITCTEQTERFLPEGCREKAFVAWQQARRDILDEWTLSTDPVNLQPKVRPMFRRAAALVRKFPPKDLDQEALDQISGALEAPWGARTENRIREALGETPNAAAALRIVQAVKELGLKPYQAPEPLPPIEIEEISIVCWMALTAI